MTKNITEGRLGSMGRPHGAENETTGTVVHCAVICGGET
jgi:hypothetical protein